MAFAPSKSKRNRRKDLGKLNLASMMDMMTIILLFLLKTFSAGGALLRPSPYLELPKAERDMEPKKAVAILILSSNSEMPPGVYEDMEKDPRVLSRADELDNPDVVILPALEAFLNEHREFAEKVGKTFKGEVTIQCDKEVRYDWLLKVINTCGQSEYSTIDFVVIKTT